MFHSIIIIIIIIWLLLPSLCLLLGHMKSCRVYSSFHKDLNQRFAASSPHPQWNGPVCNPQQVKPVHSHCLIHFHHPKMMLLFQTAVPAHLRSERTLEQLKSLVVKPELIAAAAYTCQPLVPMVTYTRCHRRLNESGFSLSCITPLLEKHFITFI